MKNEALPFAQALIDLGREEQKEDLFLKQLGWINDIYRENPELKDYLSHPAIDSKSKVDVLEQVLEPAKNMDPTLWRFMKVLCQHRMAGRIPSIFRNFRKLYDDANNIENVFVSSAVDLDSKQKEKLTKLLEKKLQKKVRLFTQTDPALIAGLKIQTENSILDNSYLNRLESMREKLLRS